VVPLDPEVAGAPAPPPPTVILYALEETFIDVEYLMAPAPPPPLPSWVGDPFPPPPPPPTTKTSTVIGGPEIVKVPGEVKV
jgi:hypothetical protein